VKVAIILLSLVSLTLGATPGSPGCSAAEHEMWISQATTEMQTIKAGRTREDLLKVFKRAGGFYTTSRLAGTYEYKGSPYIKVDVEFSETPGSEGSTVDSPKDLIKSVSKPYLASPSFD
jgi:hypothetical protein